MEHFSEFFLSENGNLASPTVPSKINSPAFYPSLNSSKIFKGGQNFVNSGNGILIDLEAKGKSRVPSQDSYADTQDTQSKKPSEHKTSGLNSVQIAPNIPLVTLFPKSLIDMGIFYTKRRAPQT